MLQAFGVRYDSPTRREDNSKLLAAFSFVTFKKIDDDDHQALNRLVERIETITPVAALREGVPDAKSRIILSAVSYLGEKYTALGF